MRRVFVVLGLLLAMVGQAMAHDVWFVQRDGVFVLAYGHGSETEKYDVKKVKEVKAYSPSGEPIAVQVSEGDGEVVVKLPDASKGLGVLTVFFDNGFWVKTPEGWKNVSKKEYGKPVEDSSRPLKFSKMVAVWSDFALKPVGLEFEVVPLGRPSKDGSLEVQVLYGGKPVEGASVEVNFDESKAVKTDAQGKAVVSGFKEGFNAVIASFKVPLEDKSEADKLSLSSTLTFNL